MRSIRQIKSNLVIYVNVKCSLAFYKGFKRKMGPFRYLPFDHSYAILSFFFYHSAIIGTQNRLAPMVVIVIKSIKTGHFRFLLRYF